MSSSVEYVWGFGSELPDAVERYVLNISLISPNQEAIFFGKSLYTLPSYYAFSLPPLPPFTVPPLLLTKMQNH